MSKGYIKLHRSIQDNPYWQEKPFSRGQAMADCILLARHASGYVRVRGIKIILQRGQLCISEKGLADKWGWSRGKVRRFLDEQEEDRFLARRRDNKISVITILNYEKYQGRNEARGTTDETLDGPQVGQQTDTNKNDIKKGKKEKRDTDDSAESSGSRPKACPQEQWDKYLAYSKAFLEKQHERWGKVVQVSEDRILAGAKTLDNLIRVQGFREEVVHGTLRWARDDSFWGLQVRSLGSLLKKGSNGESKFNNILAARATEAQNAQRHAQ